MRYRIQERHQKPGRADRWLDVSEAYLSRDSAEQALRFLNARGGADRRRIVETG